MPTVTTRSLSDKTIVIAYLFKGRGQAPTKVLRRALMTGHAWADPKGQEGGETHHGHPLDPLAESDPSDDDIPPENPEPYLKGCNL
eukprot:scaffold106040_cov37-Tisochrysis_lutea.AAC.1